MARQARLEISIEGDRFVQRLLGRKYNFAATRGQFLARFGRAGLRPDGLAVAARH
jgi:hypothetical protein